MAWKAEFNTIAFWRCCPINSLMWQWQQVRHIWKKIWKKSTRLNSFRKGNSKVPYKSKLHARFSNDIFSTKTPNSGAFLKSAKIKISQKNGDEIQSLLWQSEIVLNSRSVCFLSEDPNNDVILTTAHFCLVKKLESWLFKEYAGKTFCFPLKTLWPWKTKMDSVTEFCNS